MTKIVAVVSGGADSVSYAAMWQLKGTIVPIVFDYGQKGINEIGALIEIAKTLGWERPRVIDMTFMADLWKGSNQLTDDSIEVADTYQQNVVVPIRNMIMLSIATAYAYSIGAKTVIYGAHLSDGTVAAGPHGHPEAMYPDCTPEFVVAYETAARLAHLREYRDIEVWSPARADMTKDELLRAGYNVIGDTLFQTWSCYKSGDKHCGQCESCRNRQAAFAAAGIDDKTQYEVKVASKQADLSES